VRSHRRQRPRRPPRATNRALFGATYVSARGWVRTQRAASTYTCHAPENADVCWQPPLGTGPRHRAQCHRRGFVGWPRSARPCPNFIGRSQSIRWQQHRRAAKSRVRLRGRGDVGSPLLSPFLALIRLNCGTTFAPPAPSVNRPVGPVASYRLGMTSEAEATSPDATPVPVAAFDLALPRKRMASTVLLSTRRIES
jgi:hypothetical protein